MSKIIALVEGQTEVAIFNRALRAELIDEEIDLEARIANIPGYPGGNKIKTVREELILYLSNPGGLITTFFDYSGLTDWHDLEKAQTLPPDQAVRMLERALMQSLRDQLPGMDEKRFFPYVQMHETESLLFSNPAVLARVMEKPEFTSKCADIVKECGGCELINNDPDKYPSKRIGKLFKKYKKYRKGSSTKAHAHRIVEKTGLATIREKCPNFDQWLVEIKQRAEQLGND